MKKVIIRSPNWLGDNIMAIPFFYQILKKYRGESIIVLVPSHFVELYEILFADENIQLIGFQKNQIKGFFKLRCFLKENSLLQNADIFYLLPPSFSSAWMAFISGAKLRVGMGGDFRSFLLSRRVTSKGKHRSDHYISLLDGQGTLVGESPDTDPEDYIVINPNSEASSRRLPQEFWKNLFTKFPHINFKIVGVAKDRQRTQELSEKFDNVDDLAGCTSIKELGHVLKKAKMVISNDSGPAHFAAYLGTPLIVFFGAGDQSCTSPQGRGEIEVVNLNLSCSPCLKNTCPLGTIECLTRLRLDHLVNLPIAQKYLTP